MIRINKINIKKKFFSLLQPSQIMDQKLIKIKKQKKNKIKYKIKIISAYNKDFKKIGDFSAKSIKKYAKKFKYDYQIYRIPNNFDRPLAWYKIKLLKELIKNEKYDAFFWIDADAFFLNKKIDINDCIDKIHDIYLVAHKINLVKTSRFENTQLSIKRINSGVMVLKKTKFVKNFLEKVWNNKKYINHFWWENASIMDIIGHRAELTKNLFDNKDNKFFTKKIKYLNNVWNSIPSDGLESNLESHNPVIIHMAGRNIRERENIIKKFNINI